jgi:parallel beta-helix repeat protein
MMQVPTRTVRARAARRQPPVGARAAMEVVEPRLLLAAATFTVTTTADDGPGSLRQAIIAANTAPNDPIEGPDLIRFNLGAGVHTITPLSPLPAITDSVDLDGSTDDGVTPSVELNGSSAGAGANGLVLASSDPVFASFVTGLIINRFSGNGIRITGAGNGVGINYIGTNAAGTAAGPGNAGHGILIESSGNFVTDNTIAFNGGAGIAVANTSTGNDLSINYIFKNAGLGIDLGINGRTPNDVGDGDTGANDLQNFPVITAMAPATAPATGVNVTLSINSTPNTTLDISFYSSPTAEGQGQNFLDHTEVVTDGSGNKTFTYNLTGATMSDFITATATRVFTVDDGSQFLISTSEFSDPFPSGGDSSGPSEVYVSGSGWAAAFKTYLESKGLGDDVYGYKVYGNGAATAGPAGNPENILPWINANQIVLKYAAAPTGGGIPTTGSVSFTSAKGQAYNATSVTQVAGDPTAYVVTLNKPLGGGNPTAGTAPTTSENGDRITVGVTGSTVSLPLRVLQGDTDHTGENGTHSVLAADFSAVKKKFFKSTADPVTGADTDYSVFHDVNGSGDILANDFSEVKKRFFQDMAGVPAAAAAALDPSGVTSDFFGSKQIL